LRFQSSYQDNQGIYFENATACSKRTLKTTVATQLWSVFTTAQTGSKTMLDSKVVKIDSKIIILNPCHT